MKIGVVVDSSCGLTKEEAEKKHWYFLPLIFSINNKEFLDGIEINPKNFYKNFSIEQNVRTSATPPKMILDVFEKASKENDFVIVYGISSHLSSQTQNLKLFSQEFSNIFVVESYGVGYFIVKELEEIIEKIEKRTIDVNKGIEILNDLSKKQLGIAIPLTLEWLIKGGRVSKTVASIAKVLNIFPMILFSEGKLEKFKNSKDFIETIKNATKYIMKNSNSNDEIIIYHTENKDISKIKKIIEEISNKNIEVYYFPPVIAIHTGLGMVGIISHRKK